MLIVACNVSISLPEFDSSGPDLLLRYLTA